MIILVVTEATSDPAACLAIAAAKKVDEDMQRCIGIITKIDLYRSHSSDGKGILDRLMLKDQSADSNYFPRGFVAVRPLNRCWPWNAGYVGTPNEIPAVDPAGPQPHPR